MNYNSVVEFNKFTLAISVGCLVYTIEKALPPDTLFEQSAVIIVVLLLVVSIGCGIWVFAAATASANASEALKTEVQADEKKKHEDRITSNAKQIHVSGACHSLTLVLAIIVLTLVIWDKFAITESIKNETSCGSCPDASKEGNKKG